MAKDSKRSVLSVCYDDDGEHNDKENICLKFYDDCLVIIFFYYGDLMTNKISPFISCLQPIFKELSLHVSPKEVIMKG